MPAEESKTSCSCVYTSLHHKGSGVCPVPYGISRMYTVGVEGGRSQFEQPDRGQGRCGGMGTMLPAWLAVYSTWCAAFREVVCGPAQTPCPFSVVPCVAPQSPHLMGNALGPAPSSPPKLPRRALGLGTWALGTVETTNPGGRTCKWEETKTQKSSTGAVPES